MAVHLLQIVEGQGLGPRKVTKVASAFIPHCQYLSVIGNGEETGPPDAKLVLQLSQRPPHP